MKTATQALIATESTDLTDPTVAELVGYAIKCWESGIAPHVEIAISKRGSDKLAEFMDTSLAVLADESDSSNVTKRSKELFFEYVCTRLTTRCIADADDDLLTWLVKHSTGKFGGPKLLSNYNTSAILAFMEVLSKCTEDGCSHLITVITKDGTPSINILVPFDGWYNYIPDALKLLEVKSIALRTDKFFGFKLFEFDSNKICLYNRIHHLISTELKKTP